MKVALVLTLTLFLVDIAALTSKFQDDVTHIKRSNRECFYIFENSTLRPCFLHKKAFVPSACSNLAEKF